MKDRKRFDYGKGCLIGAVVCILLALLILPRIWWAIILSGAGGYCAGYIGYRIKDWFYGVGLAIKNSFSQIKGWASVPSKTVKEPWVIWMTVLFVIILVAEAYCVCFLGQDYLKIANTVINWVGWIISVAMALSVTLGILVYVFLVFYLPYLAVVSAGCKLCRQYCPALIKQRELGGEEEIAFLIREFQHMGYTEAELTFRNVNKWFGVAVCSLIKGFYTDVLKYVHCHERTFCGTIGMSTGLLTIYYAWPMHLSTSQIFLLAIFGGAIGAVIGMSLSELIGKAVDKTAIENC